MNSSSFQVRVAIGCLLFIYDAGSAVIACVQQPWMAAGLVPLFVLTFIFCKSTCVAVSRNFVPTTSRSLSHAEFGALATEAYPQLSRIVRHHITDPVLRKIVAWLWLKLAFHYHAFAWYLSVMLLLALWLAPFALGVPIVGIVEPASPAAGIQIPRVMFFLGFVMGSVGGAVSGLFYRWVRVHLA